MAEHKPRVNSLVGGCIADCLHLPSGNKQDVCDGDFATVCQHASVRSCRLARMAYSPPAARFLISVVPTFEETHFVCLKAKLSNENQSMRSDEEIIEIKLVIVGLYILV